MYHQYFGLSESPFSISVNPRYLFMSPRHRDALAHLLYGVGSGGGFILLTGEVGTGKTTINRCLLEQLPDTTDLAIVLNPALSATELLATVCDEFGIDYPKGTGSLKVFTDALHTFLLANHAAGRKTVLMIDEAQHLDFDVLEQIRLLTNLETNEQKLLQIILIGQPELSEKLARSELRQLNQRITARYDLQPLSEAETQAYVHHRLQVAGLPPGQRLFSDSVIREVHRLSSGIPRRINVLCERILLGAYGQQSQTISKALVRSAAREVFGTETTATPGNKLALAVSAVGMVFVMMAVGFAAVRLSPPEWLGSPTQEPDVKGREAVSIAVGQADVAATLNIPSGQSGQDIEPSYLLAPSLAEQWFWRLHSDVIPETGYCPQARANPWLCEPYAASVWEELARLKRPVILGVETPSRFQAAVIVVGFSGLEATVMTPGGLESVALAALARYWNGGYRFLWQPPKGWSGRLVEGDESEVVAEVSGLFAELDGQTRALSGGLFSIQLAQRVRFFQERMGLDVTGIIDTPTLLALRYQLSREPNMDEWLARARQLIGTI